MIDLHIHTNYSDGQYPLGVVLDLIRKNKIKYFSITDHDKLQNEKSIKKINDFCLKNDIKFKEGVEVSSKFFYGDIETSVHILGYKINQKDKLNNYLIENALKVREKRNLQMFDKFKFFFKKKRINIENLISKNSDFKRLKIGSLGRPHFAQLLVDSKICKSVEQAFEQYLTYGKPLYVPKLNLTTKEVIDVLNKTCEFSIIAHFGISFQNLFINNNFNLIYDILNVLKLYGIKGFEVFYSGHNNKMEKILLDFVIKNNLIFTAGSDFHGESIRNAKIGHISRNLNKFYQQKIIKWFFDYG